MAGEAGREPGSGARRRGDGARTGAGAVCRSPAGARVKPTPDTVPPVLSRSTGRGSTLSTRWSGVPGDTQVPHPGTPGGVGYYRVSTEGVVAAWTRPSAPPLAPASPRVGSWYQTGGTAGSRPGYRDGGGKAGPSRVVVAAWRSEVHISRSREEEPGQGWAEPEGGGGGEG